MIAAAIAAIAPMVAPAVPSVLPVATASAASLPDGASKYIPIAPKRAADTRADYGSFGFTRLSPTMIRVQITGRADLTGVPAKASAVVLNIASVGAAAPGFVTAFPSGGSIPTASSLNIDYPGRIIANMATVRLSPGGSVDLFSNTTMDLVVDVAGVYATVPDAVKGGRLVTIPGGARRALDTRDRGFPMAGDNSEFVDLSAVGVPADATAVVVNLAATEAFPGFWTAYPNGVGRPNASSLNIDQVNQTRNAQGIIALSPGPRGFNIYSQSGGHLVVDVVGWFTGEASPASTDGLFVPSAPRRTLDTRDTYDLPPWGGSTIEFSSRSPFPEQTAAVAMNIAIADPFYLGFITVYPSGVPRPNTANLNVTALDQIISNHAISRVGTRAVSVYTQSGAQIIIDVTGWYLGTPDQSTLPVLVNPNFGPTVARAVTAPAAGIGTFIAVGLNINSIVNAGYAALWGGNNTLATFDHNIYFAHRTSAGGPFRNLDRLVPGTTFNLIGADGHAYVYLVMRQDVIVPSASLLLDIVVKTGPITATLVACHPPGSIRYRIAITGRLIAVA